MYGFITSSSTLYVIRNNRIRRVSDHSVERASNGQPMSAGCGNGSFNFVKAPQQGKRFTYTVKGDNQPIRTSRVAHVLTSSEVLDELVLRAS
jgi:hypothetical protein